MDAGVLVLVAVLGVALVIVVSIVGGIRARRRRDEFRTFATRRGWAFAARDDRWATHFSGYPFDEGHDRRASNVMTGVHDARPCVVFDYVFHTTTTSTNAQGHTTTREVSHDFSVVAIDAGVAFPALRVTPEGFFSRMVGRLLNKDIEFESEDFNRAFTVTCEDRKFASDVVHPGMMELLLRRPDLAWAFDGRWIVAFHDAKHALTEIAARLEALDAVLDGIPEFVWRQARESTR